MSQSDDWEKRQELIPKDSGDGKEIATNLPWMVDYALNKSLVGLRIQKRKVDAHRKLYEAMRLAHEELSRLDDTPVRMKQERELKNADYATRGMEFAIKTLQLDLDQNRILKEIQEEKNAKDLLRLQQDLKKIELELQIAELKNKMARLDGSAHDTQSPAEPQLDQVRDDMKRYMERHRHLGNDKKKWFDQIEEDLVSKAISEELADEMKDDIEQMIRDAILKPE